VRPALHTNPCREPASAMILSTADSIDASFVTSAWRAKSWFGKLADRAAKSGPVSPMSIE
jgi:hypothetical protein